MRITDQRLTAETKQRRTLNAILGLIVGLIVAAAGVFAFFLYQAWSFFYG